MRQVGSFEMFVLSMSDRISRVSASGAVHRFSDHYYSLFDCVNAYPFIRVAGHEHAIARLANP